MADSNADETTPVLGVLDLPADDNDADWVDEDTHLQGLGTTTHRSRNPLKAVIPRKRRSRVVGAKRTADEEAARVNARATAKKRCETRLKNMEGLAADLDTLHQESEERAQELAAKYGMKVKEVRRRVHASSAFKTRRKVSLYNAKISALMARLNEDRDVGRRYTMPDIKRMVKDDPSMLEGFSKEEEGSMVDNIQEKRDKKHHGARANNLAASADAKRTVERLMEEITGLAERSGMIGFAMFTRGHIHDTSIPVTLESWGALSFFREVLKRDPADVAALFELWGVSRARGKPGDTGAETLLSMQKECTEMIKTGLQTIAGRTKIAMNYDNYIKAIVEGKNFGLLGWPRDMDFKRMSKQSAIGPLRTLRDALKAGTCRWAVLSAGQKKKLLADFQEMVDEGKATQKSAKPRGKAKPKQAGEPRTSTRAGRKGIASVRSDDDDDRGSAEENEGDASEGDATEGEEDPSRRPSAVGAREAQRQRLLALVGRKNAAAGGEGDRGGKGAGAKSTQRKGGKRKRDIGDDGAPAAKAKSRKRKRLDDDSDDDDAPPPKKKSASTRKHGQLPDKGKDAPAAKRRKASEPSRRTSSGPSPCVARPKPRPLYKVSASCTTRRSESPSRSTPPPRTGSPPAPASISHGASPPREPSPTRSASSSTRGSSGASRGRANVVKGKRGGPPGVRVM
ncbi:hypothetical protein DFH08DRAFT_967111 [Mycena albidolilacea]|uniref:Uncharacterized protein n=1 Tax=Mycena albidolilacea TaxID=1033008 RepID=A0AAD6ZMF7_9AGAR|nr:hypothetical protein DFH08DRAFT_967111 [Mycena albidolilacea]